MFQFHKPSSLRDYLIASLVTTTLIVLFGAYIFVRRGYLFDAPPTTDMLYIPNKVLASVAMTLIALTFIIGPVTRYFDRFDKWLGYRKEIGIVGGLLAILHGIVTYYLLPIEFPSEWIDFTAPQTAAGLTGAILLGLLFFISFKKAILLLGAGRWWFLQRFGLRFVVVFTLVHVYVLKWDSWIMWLVQGDGNPTLELANPWLPGLGILATLFITWVVIVRLYESVCLFRNIGLTTKEISIDPILRARGRRFFLGSLLILAILYAIVFTRFTW